MVVKHIITGWAKKWGWIDVPGAELKMSELRLRICGSCPLSKTSEFLKIINPGEAEPEFDFVKTLYCTKCKCPCEAKTLVVSESCPVGNW